MTVELRIGQFGIVDREPVEQSPNAGIFLGKGPFDDRAECFLLAEASTRSGESFAGHVVSSLGQRWTTLDMSLTGSILRLYREAHDLARDWNERSLPEHRAEIGLGCFARRGDQTVIATGGPSIIFHRSGDRCLAYYPDEAHAVPLGESKTEPLIRRISFEADDRLLMVSSEALAAIEPAMIADILALEPDRILPELYHRLAEMRDVTVILLVATSEDADGYDEDESDDPGAFLPPVIDESAVHEAQAPAHANRTRSGRPIADQARRELDAIRHRGRLRIVVPGEAPPEPVALQWAAGAESVRRFSATGNSLRLRNSTDAIRSRSFSTGLVPSPAPPPVPPPAAAAPLAEDAARAVNQRNGRRRAHTIPEGPVFEGESANPAQAIVRVRRKAGGRMRGSGALTPRAGLSALPMPPWALGVIAAIALFLLAGAFIIPDLLADDSSARYLQLVDDAQEQYAVAQAATGPGEQRDALTAARELLLRAQDTGQSDPEVTSLLDSVTADLTELDAITVPSAIQPVGSLAEFGAEPVTVSDLVVGTEHAYLLDANAGQVISMTLADGTAEAIYTTAADDDRARPVHLARDVSDGTDAVLILDAAGQMWSYSRGTGLRELDIALPAEGAFTDLAVDGGLLYVLDAQNGIIYRYTPAGSGFTSAEALLRSPDLATARRLSVYDGQIVVTNSDGTLRWYSGTTSLDLVLAGIDTPLVSPERAIPLDPATGEWAIIDPARSRVVVFQILDGTFVRQYQDTAFDGISALAVTPQGSFVYSKDALQQVTWSGDAPAADGEGDAASGEPTPAVTQVIQ